MFKNGNILVTGGTGSFGKRFAATRLERYSPKKIVVYIGQELRRLAATKLHD